MTGTAVFENLPRCVLTAAQESAVWHGKCAFDECDRATLVSCTVDIAFYTCACGKTYVLSIPKEETEKSD